MAWVYDSRSKFGVLDEYVPSLYSWNITECDIKSYCNRGYFRWGKILRKCWQDISRWGYFHDTTPNSFIKVYGFYFRVGVIFAKKTKARKTRKLPPCENFHVYSNIIQLLIPPINNVLSCLSLRQIHVRWNFTPYIYETPRHAIKLFCMFYHSFIFGSNVPCDEALSNKLDKGQGHDSFAWNFL